jgi:DNA mismatch repair protein MutS2
MLLAKGKYARNECNFAKISEEKRIFLVNGSIIPFYGKNKKQNLHTAAQTIELNEKQQIIVISGPNVGGKVSL